MMKTQSFGFNDHSFIIPIRIVAKRAHYIRPSTRPSLCLFDTPYISAGLPLNGFS